MVTQRHDEHPVALFDTAPQRRVDRLVRDGVEGVAHDLVVEEVSESLFVVVSVFGLVLDGHVGARVVVVARPATVEVRPQRRLGVSIVGRVHHEERVVAGQAAPVGAVPVEV